MQDFSYEEKTNDETDKIDKENMNEFCNLIADQETENRK